MFSAANNQIEGGLITIKVRTNPYCQLGLELRLIDSLPPTLLQMHYHFEQFFWVQIDSQLHPCAFHIHFHHHPSPNNHFHSNIHHLTVDSRQNLTPAMLGQSFLECVTSDLPSGSSGEGSIVSVKMIEFPSIFPYYWYSAIINFKKKYIFRLYLLT